MREPHPMRRLRRAMWIGQDIVALQAMLVAIENGYQAAMMGAD